jgi:hypothetical protein
LEPLLVGANGGTADLIENNTVEQCQKDGYGIWVFVPYRDPTVKDNDGRGCAVGLAAFGQGAPTTTLFTGNKLSGAGAWSSRPSGSFGVLVSTDILGYGAANVSARASFPTIARALTGERPSPFTTT